jgi:hypothetical protein
MGSMSKRDRTTLGGLVLAMIVGVGGSLGLAASCLGRDRAHRADDPISAFPEDRSARTSSGGVPGEEAVGQTEITSVELPAGAPTNTAPPAPENAPPPNPNPTPAAALTPRPIPVPQSAPQAAPVANATVNVHVAGDQVTTSSSTDAGAAPIAAPVEEARDGGATNGATRDAAAAAPTATNGTTAPPPRFATEPTSPYGASSWTANHEAGAGPFTTERNVPNNPGP